MKKPLALLLHDAINAESRPDETDVLVQVEQVSAALKANGWRTAVTAATGDLKSLQWAITGRAPRLVVNLVESLDGDGQRIHVVPELLEKMGLPFTGSSSDALRLTSQKPLAKQRMRDNGIATPRDPGTAADVADRNRRYIVKSVWEHASLGLDDTSVVTGRDAARRKIARCQKKYGGEWFAEEYIDGREFNISLLEVDGKPQVLPIPEITFVDYPENKPKIVGYAAKWDPAAVEYDATRRDFPALPKAQRRTLIDCAKRCWQLFALRGYARVDIRLATDGTPYVLEINANPCLAQDSGFVVSALAAGMAYHELIERIVAAAVPLPQEIQRRAG
ncbi:MAG: ATP-grasp domain-containing protein [Woeseia sp.]